MANTRLGRNTRIKVEGGRGTYDIKNRPHNRTSSRSKYDAGIIMPAWMTVAYAKSRSKHTHWVICRNVLLHVSREYNKIKEKKRINYATQVSYDREIPIEMYLPYQQSICLSGLCHREQTRRRNANEEARANPERIKTGEQGTLSPWPQQRLSVKAGSPSRGGSSSYQGPRHLFRFSWVEWATDSLPQKATAASRYGLEWAGDTSGNIPESAEGERGGRHRQGGPWQQQ